MSNPPPDEYRRQAWPYFGTRLAARKHNSPLDYQNLRHGIKQRTDECQGSVSHRYQEIFLHQEMAHTCNAEALKRFAENQGSGSEMLTMLMLEYDRAMQSIRQDLEWALKAYNAASEDARSDLLGGLVRLEEVSYDD